MIKILLQYKYGNKHDVERSFNDLSEDVKQI